MPEAFADDVFNSHECATDNEQDVTRVHLNVLLLRVFASALRVARLLLFPQASSAGFVAHPRPTHHA